MRRPLTPNQVTTLLRAVAAILRAGGWTVTVDGCGLKAVKK